MMRGQHRFPLRARVDALARDRAALLQTGPRTDRRRLIHTHARLARRAAVTCLLAMGTLLATASLAHAQVSAESELTFPPAVTVGNLGYSASLTLINANTGDDGPETNTVCNEGDPAPCDGGIEVVPSCGQQFVGVCTPTGSDPGVFDLGATGTGRAGTECAAMIFDVLEIGDAAGTLRIVPQGGGHVQLPGSRAQCTIDLGFNVLRLPAADADPVMDGVQTIQTSRHSVRSTFGSAFATASSRTTVLPGAPVDPPPPGTGNLVGSVTDLPGAPQPGAPVQACPVPLAAQPCLVTQSDADGRFGLLAIPPGSYELIANPAAGDAAHAPATAVRAEVVDGQTTFRAVVLRDAGAVPAGSSVDSAFAISPGGIPAVRWTDPIALRTTACAGGSVQYAVAVRDVVLSSGPMARGAITGTPPNAVASYTATAPPTNPVFGIATITFTVAGCADNTPIVFNIYIDPSGTVITARDRLPIAGATVRLLRSDAAAGPFSYVPDGSAIMSPSNRRTPDITNADGVFGWDVLAGFYVVHASKAGCGPTTGNYPRAFPGTSAGSLPGSYPGESPATTPVLQIPPPALNLEIRLDCGGPKAEPSTTVLTFPATTVGATSSPQTFTIANAGAERLHLELPLVPTTGRAVDFNVASDCPAAMDPGATCTATVRFEPKAPTGETRSSKLVLAGDSDGPTSSVTLTTTPPPVAPPPGPPPPSPSPAPAKFAAGCVQTITRVSRTRYIAFACRLSVVGSARLLRISRCRLGRTRLSPFAGVQSRTVRLVRGRATVRLRLSRSDARRVRRSGRRGVRVAVRAQALGSTRQVLVSQTKWTRLRRA